MGVMVRKKKASADEATRVKGGTPCSDGSQRDSFESDGNSTPLFAPSSGEWNRTSMTVASAIDYIRHCHPSLPSIGARKCLEALNFEGQDEEAWRELIYISVAAAMQGKLVPFRRFDKFPWAVVHFLFQYFERLKHASGSGCSFFDPLASQEFGSSFFQSSSGHPEFLRRQA